jgi:hypothetical protein
MAFISAAGAVTFCFALMAAARLDLAVEYLRIRLALDLQNADKAAFGARQSVIDKDVCRARRA